MNSGIYFDDVYMEDEDEDEEQRTISLVTQLEEIDRVCHFLVVFVYFCIFISFYLANRKTSKQKI